MSPGFLKIRVIKRRREREGFVKRVYQIKTGEESHTAREDLTTRDTNQIVRGERVDAVTTTLLHTLRTSEFNAENHTVHNSVYITDDHNTPLKPRHDIVRPDE